ncbi:MAG: FeoB-associated Cys-rich membrane protein [Bacteroidales bacterium]|nr:FeoB-associated Cys-rich membrane protein [Bacteroidales bacterium]MDE6236607.1 FeoB-associated Cys-rich membrane protein [Muribaculaceae bacterium]MDE6537706.1 FeoB-associated Cys-rich membrane protein [Muribaculaceae bacterium]MDE6867376.1 FeoB-associated Cys-rich membrane protein [Muribaculaceae bacterium]
MNWQIIIVYLIIASAIGWIIYRLAIKPKDKGGECCNCALSKKCNRPEKAKSRKH